MFVDLREFMRLDLGNYVVVWMMERGLFCECLPVMLLFYSDPSIMFRIFIELGGD